MSGHLFTLFQSRVWYCWRTRTGFAIGIRSMIAAPGMPIVVVGIFLRLLERRQRIPASFSKLLPAGSPKHFRWQKKQSLELNETDTLYGIGIFG